MAAPPEVILQFIINYLWTQMTQESSQFFLPKLLSQQNDSYDPYNVGEWDMGTLPESNDAVCMSGNDMGSCVGHPTLKLTNVVIKGLYNIQPGADKPVVNNSNVQATLDFCTLAPGPYVTSQYIVVTGNYTYTQLCKDSQDPNQYTTTGTGSFDATVFTGQGTANFDIAPDPNSPTNLIVTVNSMGVIMPATTATPNCSAPGASKNSNICISISMDGNNEYNFLANQAANYAKVSSEIVSNLNLKLQDPKALADLGTVLTQQVNNIFQSGEMKQFMKRMKMK